MFQRNKIKKLEYQIDQLKKENEHLRSDIIHSPSRYISNILGHNIEWYDYQKMDSGNRITYYNTAQTITNSDVFQNELKHYIADLVHYCATLSGNADEKIRKLEATQASIVALETFRERLESIENPTKPISNEDKFSPI